MSEIKNSLKISAPITPYDTRDSYPTHYEEYGSGGYRTVETLQDRNLIPELRRKEGMLVCVLEDGMWYSLQGGITNDHWVNFKKSIGLIDDSQLVVSDQEPIEPTAKTVWLNPVNRILKFRDVGNTTWNVLNITIVDGGEF